MATIASALLAKFNEGESVASISAVKKALRAQYPKITFKSAADFYGDSAGNRKALWVQDSSVEDKDNGLEFSNYYSHNDSYQMGINVNAVEILRSLGWWAAHHDAETIMLYPN